MPLDIVNVGTAPNSGNGDALRVAFQQLNTRLHQIAALLNNRGAWVTATLYSASDRDWVVQGALAYIAAVTHTSGVFATDLAAGKWLAVDAAQILLDMASTGPGHGTTMMAHLQPAVGAISEPLDLTLSRFVHIDQFGPAADGTDDLGPLTQFFNSAIASPGIPHYMGEAVYGCSGPLPDINVSGVRIFGVWGANHSVGALKGSIIRALSGNTGPMLTVSAVAGAGNQALKGITLDGITFDCNNIASHGLVWRSANESHLRVMCSEATNCGLLMDAVASLGDPADPQRNQIIYFGKQLVASSGVSLWVSGTTTANTSFNVFQHVDIVHSNAVAIREQNSDNNLWISTRTFCAGSAVNSIEWLGGATLAETCRNETFILLSTNKPAIAKGTASYTYGAKDIVIENLDITNSSPTPTEESGASIYDNRWRSLTGTPTAGSGALTSASYTLRYMRAKKRMHVAVAVSITTNGSAASNIQVPMPAAAANNVGSGGVFAGQILSTASALTGVMAQNTSFLKIGTYSGGYPGSDGVTLFLDGHFETA